MMSLEAALSGFEGAENIVEFSSSSAGDAVARGRSRFPARFLFAVAALLAIAALLVSKLVDDLWPPQPESKGGSLAVEGPTEENAVPPHHRRGTPIGYRTTRIENDVVDSWVEGIYRGADDQLYQKVVRKFMDTVAYLDPKTGRTIEIQKPRLQTVYVPVDGPF
jgi:hypothetical protein